MPIHIVIHENTPLSPPSFHWSAILYCQKSFCLAIFLFPGAIHLAGASRVLLASRLYGQGQSSPPLPCCFAVSSCIAIIYHW